MKTERDQWREELASKAELSATEIAKLEDQLDDSMKDLDDLPLSEKERFLLAANRIGRPVELGGDSTELPGRRLKSVLQLLVLGIFGYIVCGALAALLTQSFAAVVAAYTEGSGGGILFRGGMYIPFLKVPICLLLCAWVSAHPEWLLRFATKLETFRGFALIALCTWAASLVPRAVSALIEKAGADIREVPAGEIVSFEWELAIGAGVALPILYFVFLPLLIRREIRQARA